MDLISAVVFELDYPASCEFGEFDVAFCFDDCEPGGLDSPPAFFLARDLEVEYARNSLELAGTVRRPADRHPGDRLDQMILNVLAEKLPVFAEVAPGFEIGNGFGMNLCRIEDAAIVVMRA